MAQAVDLGIRLRTQAQPEGDCLRWTGRHTRQGYGQIYVRGKYIYVHRIAYTLAKGVIGDGLQIDHLCGNPWCINPDHLEAVTPAENVRRSNNPTAVNARKAHCVHGHPLTGTNLRITAQGYRACRLCADRRRAANWERNREQINEDRRRRRAEAKLAIAEGWE